MRQGVRGDPERKESGNVQGIQVAVPARDGREGNGRSDVSRAGEGGVIGMKGRLGAWTN